MGWWLNLFLIFEFRQIRSERSRKEEEVARSCSSLQAANTARVRVSIPLELHGLLWISKKVH